jgi:hypothetical protein
LQHSGEDRYIKQIPPRPVPSKRARRSDVDVFLANPVQKNSADEVFDSDVDTDNEAPAAKVNLFIYYLLFYGILRDHLLLQKAAQVQPKTPPGPTAKVFCAVCPAYKCTCGSVFAPTTPVSSLFYVVFLWNEMK